MQRLIKIIHYMIIHYMYNNQHKSIVFHLFMLVAHTKKVVHEIFLKMILNYNFLYIVSMYILH